jgi:hypothetical protein
LLHYNVRLRRNVDQTVEHIDNTAAGQLEFLLVRLFSSMAPSLPDGRGDDQFANARNFEVGITASVDVANEVDALEALVGSVFPDL